MVGRETCKNRLILRLLQPCAIEFNDLQAGLSTLGIAVVVEQGQLLGGGGGQLVPELLDAMVTEAAGAMYER